MLNKFELIFSSIFSIKPYDKSKRDRRQKLENVKK